MYSLNISAFDGFYYAYTTLDIKVIDENDNIPKFDRKVFSVLLKDGYNKGEKIIKVSAKDDDVGLNSVLTYWLYETSGKFHIDPATGVINITGELTEDIYTFKVFVRDYGVPFLTNNATVLVSRVETNRFSPKFEQYGYKITVPENSPVNTDLITVHVIDRDIGDAGTIDLKLITDIDDRNMFSINQNGTVKLMQPLDYEVKNLFELKILATDHALNPKNTQAFLQITVSNINDRPPVFEPSPKLISLVQPVVSKVEIYRFKAVDTDSDVPSSVTYQLSEVSNEFVIDYQSGILETKTTLRSGIYNISVVAIEKSGLKTVVLVGIEVLAQSLKEKYPLFLPYSPDVFKITVEEGKSGLMPVLDLPAALSDENMVNDIKYSLWDKTNSTPFYVDENKVTPLINVSEFE